MKKTPLAAALHLPQYRYAGCTEAIHNPQGSDIEDLPVIYGYNNGGSPGWYSALLLAEDGTPLAEQLCSDESYMPRDLGIVEGARPDHHVRFQKHYPDGYRTEFVSHDDIGNHAGLMKAIATANKKLRGRHEH